MVARSCWRENSTGRSSGEGLEMDRRAARLSLSSRQPLFKDFKQVRKIKTFVGTSADALTIQTRTAVVASVMVRYPPETRSPLPMGDLALNTRKLTPQVFCFPFSPGRSPAHIGTSDFFCTLHPLLALIPLFGWVCLAGVASKAGAINRLDRMLPCSWSEDCSYSIWVDLCPLFQSGFT